MTRWAEDVKLTAVEVEILLCFYGGFRWVSCVSGVYVFLLVVNVALLFQINLFQGFKLCGLKLNNPENAMQLLVDLDPKRYELKSNKDHGRSITREQVGWDEGTWLRKQIHNMSVHCHAV